MPGDSWYIFWFLLLGSPVGREWEFRMMFGGQEMGSAHFASHWSCLWVRKQNYQSMVTDTRRQMAAGVGFLMHDELSHLLAWPCKVHSQRKFLRKNRRKHHLKRRKCQAVISFQSSWSFYSSYSSAAAQSGRDPTGPRGPSRWQSLSWYPGEVTVCQNEGLRLLETAPKMPMNPSG